MDNATNASANKVHCHDCHKSLQVKGQKIIGGRLCVYQHQDQKISIYKCQRCFKKNPALTNFQNCEVYSRIVGYLRPIKQWNEGKQQEFNRRKTYHLEY